MSAWDEFSPAGNSSWDEFGKASSVAKSGAIADFLKSIPHGLMGGLSKTLSASGQAAQLEMSQPVDTPQPEEVRSALEKNITGPTYQPQGRSGQFGSAIGEGLGNPASYLGPGGLALKVGGSVLSSIGGEGGKQLAEGTPYEIPAAIAGSVLGGAAAAKTLGPTIPKSAVPNYRELKDAATADYNAARGSGLELHPLGVASVASKIEQELGGPNHGFTGGQFGDAPKTFNILDNLQNPPAGATISASNLDAIRKNVARLSRETVEGKPTPDAAAASVALRRLNEYTENIPQNHILAGDAADYVRATQQGNQNYAAAQRVRTVDAKIARAENNAEGGIATSIDNQIKSQIRTILNSPKAQRGYSPEELAAMRVLNKGTLISNILRQLGRGGAGVIPVGMHLATATATGGASVPFQAALATGLYGARKTAEAMTKSRAEKLAEMLAKRSPEYKRRLANLPAFDNSPNVAATLRSLMLGLPSP